MTATSGELQTGAAARSSTTVITNAQFAISKGQASRQRRYAITMAFRTACFVAMIFVPGTFRWVLFAGAVFLPYVAVLFANQADTRTALTEIQPASPPRLQLSAGSPSPEIIDGTVVGASMEKPEDDEGPYLSADADRHSA